MRKKIIARKRSGIRVVPAEDIIFMEKRLRKIIMYTCDEQIEFYGRFLEVLPYLDERFLFCHRSYIVNMDEVVVMDRGTIGFSNNQNIYFGRDKYRAARKTILGYLSEKHKNT